jgi:hypothetical protein
MSRALPEKYRQAGRIQEGYEIHTTEGAWLPVKQVLRIYAPANIVRFTFDDGEAFVAVPTEEVMSRRPAGVS